MSQQQTSGREEGERASGRSCEVGDEKAAREQLSPGGESWLRHSQARTEQRLYRGRSRIFCRSGERRDNGLHPTHLAISIALPRHALESVAFLFRHGRSSSPIHDKVPHRLYLLRFTSVHNKCSGLPQSLALSHDRSERGH